ncbi:MAG: PIN domain-containing protein [Pseudomonadota bacterium]
MRVVLDTCVLYPTVMREVLLGVAARGGFEPLWSPRILEEWARAAVKLGPAGEAQARGEIALLRSDWPAAERAVPEGLAARLWLPDADDVHVLALAVDASADAVMTLNARDFPRGVLAEEGLSRVDPDGFLMTLFPLMENDIRDAAETVLATAQSMTSKDWSMRALMKKARLPRLGKALSS